MSPSRASAIIALLILLLAPATFAQGRGQNQPEAAWWDRALSGQSRYYRIKSDLRPSEARDLANHLDLMYEAYHRRLGSLPQRMPDQLNVLIFESRDEYIATLGSRYNVNAMGTGGVFMPNHATLAFWTEHLPRQRVLHVLQHEGFHQFAYSRFGRDLPPWVNEGLAEFFGEAVMVGRTLVIGQSKPRVIEAVQDAVERDEHIPFRELLTMSQLQWNSAMHSGSSRSGGSGGASLQYSQSWSMVHFLIYGGGGRYVDAFERYLRQVAIAVPSEEAFIRAFGTDDFDAFEERWREYVLEARPSAFVTALERAELLAEGLLELSRRRIYPKSLDELKAALRAIDFSYIVQSHGVVTVLDVEEDDVFTIPRDEHAKDQPIFVVTEPPRRRRGQTHRQRLLEEENPTPPTLATEHLRPHGITIEWNRDAATNILSYELIVR